MVFTSKIRPGPNHERQHGGRSKKCGGFRRLNSLGKVAQPPRGHAGDGHHQPETVPKGRVGGHDDSCSKRSIKVLLAIIGPLLFGPTGREARFRQRWALPGWFRCNGFRVHG